MTPAPRSPGWLVAAWHPSPEGHRGSGSGSPGVNRTQGNRHHRHGACSSPVSIGPGHHSAARPASGPDWRHASVLRSPIGPTPMRPRTPGEARQAENVVSSLVDPITAQQWSDQLDGELSGNLHLDEHSSPRAQPLQTIRGHGRGSTATEWQPRQSPAGDGSDLPRRRMSPSPAAREQSAGSQLFQA